MFCVAVSHFFFSSSFSCHFFYHSHSFIHTVMHGVSLCVYVCLGGFFGIRRTSSLKQYQRINASCIVHRMTPERGSATGPSFPVKCHVASEALCVRLSFRLHAFIRPAIPFPTCAHRSRPLHVEIVTGRIIITV